MKYSIQSKILVWFSIIVFIGLASLLFVSYQITEQNTAKIIENDMIAVKKNLDVYLKQYFLINNKELNEKNLLDNADNISRELGSEIGNKVEIYNLTGEKISNFLTLDKLDNSDLLKAVNGQIAYSISYNENKVLVNLSYPINIKNISIGIIRYSKDYTEIYTYNNRFKHVINIFATVIFTIIFIASIIISMQIAKPIVELTKNSEKVSKGNFDLNIKINSKDEIGELSNRFKIMVERIKEQITIIERERDNLKEAQKQNKAFFDNVTHELKTPLTTILGYAQIIQDNGFNDKDFFDKGTSYIIKESKRLNNMVVEILELSTASLKDVSYDFEKINLSKLVRNTCDEMDIKARKYNIRILQHIEDDLFIKGDNNKLKEVLINLIDNSIKYGNVNSTIEVEGYLKEEYIYLKIKDKGEGIAEEHINNIFQPFYRISKSESREKGSAGLGLSIVKNIVEKHGGTIDIKSRVKEGTEVIIRFEGDEYE